MRRRTLVGLRWLGGLGMVAMLGGCAGGEQPVAPPPADASLAETKTDAEPAEAPEAAPTDAKPPEADPTAPEAPEADAKPPEAPQADPAAPQADPAAPEATPTEAPPAADPAAPTGPVIVKRELQLEHEHIGELHYGMTAEEVVAVLGEPAKKSKIEMEEATADYVSYWKYPDHDLSVGMRSAKRKGKQTVRSLQAGPACTLPGPWGLKIGSTRDEVKKVYGKHYDRDFTDSKVFVAGSIYGGTMYTFKQGKVVEIFIGAAAE